jgi:hypothetical protein
MAKKTTHRSRSETKLCAVRDKKGRFVDIQTYKRAHGQDIKRKSWLEKKFGKAAQPAQSAVTMKKKTIVKDRLFGRSSWPPLRCVVARVE